MTSKKQHCVNFSEVWECQPHKGRNPTTDPANQQMLMMTETRKKLKGFGNDMFVKCRLNKYAAIKCKYRVWAFCTYALKGVIENQTKLFTEKALYFRRKVDTIWLADYITYTIQNRHSNTYFLEIIKKYITPKTFYKKFFFYPFWQNFTSCSMQPSLSNKSCFLFQQVVSNKLLCAS